MIGRFDGRAMVTLRRRRAFLAAVLRAGRGGLGERELRSLVDAGLFRVRRSAFDRGRSA